MWLDPHADPPHLLCECRRPTSIVYLRPTSFCPPPRKPEPFQIDADEAEPRASEILAGLQFTPEVRPQESKQLSFAFFLFSRSLPLFPSRSRLTTLFRFFFFFVSCVLPASVPLTHGPDD